MKKFLQYEIKSAIQFIHIEWQFYRLKTVPSLVITQFSELNDSEAKANVLFFTHLVGHKLLYKTSHAPAVLSA